MTGGPPRLSSGGEMDPEGDAGLCSQKKGERGG